MLKVYKAGQGVIQIGANENLMDFVDVRNVAHAHLLAARALSAAPVDPSTFTDRLPPVYSTVPFRPVPTSDHLDPFSPTPNPHPDPPLPAHRNRYNQFHARSEPLGAAGEAFYISNGEPVPFWSLTRAVYYAYSGRELPFTVRMSRSIGMALGAVSEAWVWLWGLNIHDVGLTRHNIGIATEHMYFDVERARRVLGYEPVVSLEQSVRDTCEWFREEEKREEAKKKGEAKKTR